MNHAWQDCEVDLNQHIVRVYDLETGCVRIDTSTVNSYADVVDGQGYLQFGHSKDRDDLPQIKVAIATLDPLGMPVTTFVVPGNCADDPLYVPEIRKVQQAFGQGGKTFVCDCKAASLGTRAYLASTKDYYLCPLPETQISARQRREWLQPVWAGQQLLQQVRRPAEEGEPEELVAEGFFLDVPLQAEVNGEVVSWTERRWLVRSMAYAAGQDKQLQRRLQTAQQQLAGLSERKQGKKRLTADELQAAAEAIVTKQRVEGMLQVVVQTTTHRKNVRGYGDQPGRVEKEQEHRVEVSRDEKVIEQAKREMGWRVYGTNQLPLSLEEVVWGYRGQNRLESNWSRLKGQPLGLMPMYLQHESRIVGLVLLLSLALRLLSIVEWTVRKKLGENKETLKGLYAGQAGRQTKRPSAELLLKAFKGISLVIVQMAGQWTAVIPPLTALQNRLLELCGLPPDLYLRLTMNFP
jgi:transposase